MFFAFEDAFVFAKSKKSATQHPLQPPHVGLLMGFNRLQKYSIFFHLPSIRASHLAHEALGQRLKVESLRLRLSAAGAPCRIKAVSN